MSPLSQSPRSRRNIPSVDRVVRLLDATDLPRPIVVEVVRRQLAELRDDANGIASAGIDPVLTRVRQALDDLRRSRIQPVINATGIIIHTNLGRSPMSDPVVAAVAQAAENFTNLEYDLSAGQRGSRGAYLENALAVLCGAPAATVVNNCAAALLLAVRHFTASPERNQVVISRGQLVQIGGGFRIPEILQAAGAQLCEIGTTNKTSVQDYRDAITPRTALILKVHHSNFFMDGFVGAPSTQEIAPIARKADVPLLEDLGSGAVFDTTTLGPEHEPTPQETLAAGADLVCFSGDKLLGGPQAGIIAGSARHIAALKKNPFFRALRCDKLILAALETTVDLLLGGQINQVPIRAMMQTDVESLRHRAQKILAMLSDLPISAIIGTGKSQVGGGSLPRTVLPSVTIDLQSLSQPVERLAELLRSATPPVIGYIEHDRLKLDLRTVFPRQDEALAAAIRLAINEHA